MTEIQPNGDEAHLTFALYASCQVYLIEEFPVPVDAPKEREVERASAPPEIQEKIIEVPVEIRVERQVAIERFVDRVVDIPVERKVDRIVEVPMDRYVERVMEVPVERIVEKIVYVDREPVQYVSEPVYETRKRVVHVPVMVMQDQEIEEVVEVGRRHMVVQSPVMASDRSVAVGVGLALQRSDLVSTGP